MASVRCADDVSSRPQQYAGSAIHRNVRQTFINVSMTNVQLIIVAANAQSRINVAANGVFREGGLAPVPLKKSDNLLPTTLVVQIKQFVRCMCVSLCLSVSTDNF